MSQKQDEVPLNEEELQNLNESFQSILDKAKKNKQRFNAILEILKIVDNKDSKEVVSSWLSRYHQSNNREKDCISWVNLNYVTVLEVISEKLSRSSEGFFSKIIHTGAQEKEISLSLETLSRIFEMLEENSVKDLMQGVYRNSIIHILYCCLEYKSKFSIRTLGLLILFKIITSYELHMFSKLHELSLLTLFTYVLDFQALTKPIASNSIRDLCVFNSPGSGKPTWANQIKEQNPSTSEFQFLEEIWKYMQRDDKNARKWLIILCRTWFQLCFDQKYLQWSEQYFKRPDSVTKNYYLITGLAIQQIQLDQPTTLMMQTAFLKQLNFFLVILSTQKKEKIRERKGQQQNYTIASKDNEKDQLLREDEYIQLLELMKTFFSKEEFLKISNDIINSLADQTGSLGDAIPVSFENGSTVLLMKVIDTIEESISSEISIIQKKQQIYQGKIFSKRIESYIYCLHKYKEDTTKTSQFFKIFCTRVNKIANDMQEKSKCYFPSFLVLNRLTLWIPPESNDIINQSIKTPKILMDLVFLLINYQERILLMQLERHKIINKDLSFMDLTQIREGLEQQTCKTLERYNVLRNMCEIPKNITCSFLDKIYNPDLQQLFSEKISFKGDILKENEEIHSEDVLPMILKCVEIRAKKRSNIILEQKEENPQEIEYSNELIAEKDLVKEFKILDFNDLLQSILKNEEMIQEEEQAALKLQKKQAEAEKLAMQKKKNSASFTPIGNNTKDSAIRDSKRNAVSAKSSFATKSSLIESAEKNDPLKGISFLSKLEIEKNILSLVQQSDRNKDIPAIEEEIKELESSQSDCKVFILPNQTNQTEEEELLIQNKQNNPLQNLEGNFLTPPKSYESSNLQFNDPSQVNDYQKRSSSGQKFKEIQQEIKLEELSTQLILLLYKAQLLCLRQNENSVLSSKYIYEFVRCFSVPNLFIHNSTSSNYVQSQNSLQTTTKQGGTSSHNKQSTISLQIRFPSSVPVILTILSPIMRNKPQSIQQMSNPSLESVFLLQMCYHSKSFFHLFSKASTLSSYNQETFNQFLQLLNFSLSPNSNPVLKTLSFICNKNIFSIFPKLLQDLSLVKQLLTSAYSALEYILKSKTVPKDYFFYLQILFASRDFQAALQQKHASSQQINQNNSPTAQPSQPMKNDKQQQDINSQQQPNSKNQPKTDITNIVPSKIKRGSILSTSAAHPAVPHTSNTQVFPYSPATKQGNSPPQPTLPPKSPMISSSPKEQTIEALNLNKNSKTSSPTQNSEEEYLRKVKSRILKSIVILVKNVVQIGNLRQELSPLISNFISLLADNLTLFLEFGSQGLSNLFSNHSIVHLYSLFFIVLIDPNFIPELKNKIWEFVLRCLQTEGKLVSDSIQFIESFALTETMSSIPKSIINKIMRVITLMLTETAQDDHPTARQLLNCLQSWIFNFRYFEINCRKHYKDTKKFLENIIKALSSLSLIEELQPDVHFFLSQLLKNYLHQNQDQMIRFTLDSEDFQMIESQLDDTSNQESDSEELHQTQMNKMNLTLLNRESIYQTVSCHESMKEQQLIFSQIWKIEKEILKSSVKEVTLPQSLTNNKNNMTVPLPNKKNSLKKRGSDVNELYMMITSLINSKYFSLSINKDKLLSFLIDKRNQLFAILRDANGKFVWKVPENSSLEEETKSDGICDKVIEIEDNKKNTKKSQLQKMIEQIIYFIHEQIAKSENFMEPLNFDEPQDNQYIPRNMQAIFSQQPPHSNIAASQTKHGSSQSEIIARSIKSFIKEIPFILKQDEKCQILDHNNDTFLNIITQIDQYSTSDKVKIGILYMGENKFKEQEILKAQEGSPQYESFLERLGEKIMLKTHQGFLGGLSGERDGEWTIYNYFYNCEVIYHVATMMPAKNKDDKQFVSKKRHIGNDFVNIIWNESGRQFQPSMVPSQLTTAYIVIQPLVSNYFSINIIRKDKVNISQNQIVIIFFEQMEDYFFPWIDKSIVHNQYLDVIVKIVSLQAKARHHQNIPSNALRPFKSRQRLLQQMEESLIMPGTGIQLIGELFSFPHIPEKVKQNVVSSQNEIKLSPRNNGQTNAIKITKKQ